MIFRYIILESATSMRGDPALHQFIGTETCLVDVDPLHDFIGEGGLFECVYGPMDIEPLRRVQETIATVMRTYRGKMFFALVMSHYCRGQFNHKDPRLEALCAEAEGMKLILPEELEQLFNLRFTKTGNSVLSASGFIKKIEKGGLFKNLWLTGITTTSCIEATINECRHEATKHVRIIVAKDAVASRRSRRRGKDGELKLFKDWSNPSAENLYVFDSWRDVPIVSGPSAA